MPRQNPRVSCTAGEEDGSLTRPLSDERRVRSDFEARVLFEDEFGSRFYRERRAGDGDGPADDVPTAVVAERGVFADIGFESLWVGFLGEDAVQFPNATRFPPDDGASVSVPGVVPSAVVFESGPSVAFDVTVPTSSPVESELHPARPFASAPAPMIFNNRRRRISVFDGSSVMRYRSDRQWRYSSKFSIIPRRIRALSRD